MLRSVLSGTATATTEALRRRGLRLAWLVVTWDVVEGVVAVAAGLAAGSIALVGFGNDSGIEVFAASSSSGSCAAARKRGCGRLCG
jgi:hypothetical protein